MVGLNGAGSVLAEDRLGAAFDQHSPVERLVLRYLAASGRPRRGSAVERVEHLMLGSDLAADLLDPRIPRLLLRHLSGRDLP